MSQFEQSFRLASERGTGVSCDEEGLFVGAAPLLENGHDPSGAARWRPRRLPDLNLDLGKCYGLPVGCDEKVPGLAAVARALDRGDVVHAQIVALHLRFPDPPELRKSAQTTADIFDLARRLRASGLLKADWAPAKHPRWPARSPDGIGGEFAPGEGVTGGAVSQGPSASLLPAQFAVPLPFETPIPSAIPFPSEIVFPPIVGPGINPREVPSNPYPNRPECVEEWARAEKYCYELAKNKRLGKGDYRGMGSFSTNA